MDEKTLDETIKNTPITIGRAIKLLSIAATSLGVLWAIHVWVGGHIEFHLMTKAEAAELKNEISAVAQAAKDASTAAKEASQAAAQTGQALQMYIQQQELKTARERLSALQGQLSDTQLWEASNRANDISRARKADLQRQIDVLRDYVQCLQNGRSLCQN